MVHDSKLSLIFLNIIIILNQYLRRRIFVLKEPTLILLSWVKNESSAMRITMFGKGTFRNYVCTKGGGGVN